MPLKGLGLLFQGVDAVSFFSAILQPFPQGLHSWISGEDADPSKTSVLNRIHEVPAINHRTTVFWPDLTGLCRFEGNPILGGFKGNLKMTHLSL